MIIVIHAIVCKFPILFTEENLFIFVYVIVRSSVYFVCVKHLPQIKILVEKKCHAFICKNIY